MSASCRQRCNARSLGCGFRHLGSESRCLVPSSEITRWNLLGTLHAQGFTSSSSGFEGFGGKPQAPKSKSPMDSPSQTLNPKPQAFSKRKATASSDPPQAASVSQWKIQGPQSRSALQTERGFGPQSRPKAQSPHLGQSALKRAEDQAAQCRQQIPNLLAARTSASDHHVCFWLRGALSWVVRV